MIAMIWNDGLRGCDWSGAEGAGYAGGWGCCWRFWVVLVWGFPASAGIPRLTALKAPSSRPLTSSTKGAFRETPLRAVRTFAAVKDCQDGCLW